MGRPGLLAAVITIELAGRDRRLLNQWNTRLYNALQDSNWDDFVYEIGVFRVLATAPSCSRSTSSISTNGCKFAGGAG